MSTLGVVEEILRETEYPMSVRDIVEYAHGRLPTRSKTPETVVARDLSMDIKKKGEASLFIRTAPGRYTLRAIHVKTQEQAQEQTGAAEPTPLASSAIRRERAGVLPARSASSADGQASQSGGGH